MLGKWQLMGGCAVRELLGMTIEELNEIVWLEGANGVLKQNCMYSTI